MDEKTKSNEKAKEVFFPNGGKRHEGASRGAKTRNRMTWDRPAEFILAVIGYSVGLGNVWRFPYLCYKNGGGAFLIPYILMAIIGGLPLFFLEIAVGQYTKQGAIGAWSLAPAMKGIGYGSMLIAFYSVISYILVMAWSIFYMFHSFTLGPLPWTTCGNDWNTNSCLPILTNALNSTASHIGQNTSTMVSSVEEFWRHYVLRQSDGIDNMGSLTNWKLILCFIAAWALIYVCSFRGIKSSGKAVYFTATFPYLMLIVLFFRAVTLEGAGKGIIFYLRPNMTKLIEPQVWIDAGTQIFYSYGICFTALFAFGSFNKFNNDCHRQSFLLVTTASASSIFAGFAIFSFLGHLAFMHNKEMSDVVQSGPGLAFLAYPTGVALLPFPQVWSVLFFGMLILVGIDSQFADLEGFITGLGDIWPKAIFGKNRREIATTVVCFMCMVIGLPLLTNGGIYLFQLYNYYAASGISLLWLTFFESVTIGWIYGADKFYDNVKTMIGRPPNPYFKYCYRYLTPAITMFIFIFYCAKYKRLEVGTYEYPVWADLVGWIMSLSSILCVPLFFAVSVLREKGNFRERLSRALAPRLGNHLAPNGDSIGYVSGETMLEKVNSDYSP